MEVCAYVKGEEFVPFNAHTEGDVGPEGDA